MTTLRFVQKFIASVPRRRVRFRKPRNAGKASPTKVEALVLLTAIVALFCVVYVLTLWFEPK